MEEDRYTRITLRLPKELHAQLDRAADATSKSTNAEIVARLQQSFVQADVQGYQQALEHSNRLIQLLAGTIHKMVPRVLDSDGQSAEQTKLLVDFYEAMAEQPLNWNTRVQVGEVGGADPAPPAKKPKSRR